MANFPLLLLEILWGNGGGGYRFGGKLWVFVVVCFCFGYFCFVCVLLFVVFCFLMSACFVVVLGGQVFRLLACLFVANVSFVSVVCLVLFFVGLFLFLFFTRRPGTVHDQ